VEGPQPPPPPPLIAPRACSIRATFQSRLRVSSCEPHRFVAWESMHVEGFSNPQSRVWRVLVDQDFVSGSRVIASAELKLHWRQLQVPLAAPRRVSAGLGGVESPGSARSRCLSLGKHLRRGPSSTSSPRIHHEQPFGPSHQEKIKVMAGHHDRCFLLAWICVGAEAIARGNGPGLEVGGGFIERSNSSGSSIITSASARVAFSRPG